MLPVKTIDRIYPQRLIFLLMTLLLASCLYQTIAPYNPKTDQTLQLLAKDIQRVLINTESAIGTPQGEYTHFAAQYRKLNQHIQAFKRSQEKVLHNERMVKQTNLLLDALKRTESLHQGKFDNIDTVKLLREELRLLLNAMLTLERNKPRETI